MRDRLLLMLAVQARSDPVVEREAFQANQPPGLSEAATRSKTRRRSGQVGRCNSARAGQ
jgi:hypothetical protein